MFRLIIGFVIGLFRWRSANSNTQRSLSNVDERNAANKNVTEFRSAQLEAFLPDDPSGNAVISGENEALRHAAVCTAAWRSHAAGRAAVILHCGSAALGGILRESFRGVDGFTCVDSSDPVYDPFVGRDRSQAVRFVLAASDEEHKIGRGGESYLYGICDFLLQTGRIPCVAAFSDCLESRSYEELMDLAERGSVSEFVVRRINSELAQGMAQAGEAEFFFQSLRSEAGGILAQERNIREAVSIRSAVQGGGVISLDIGSASNALLLNTVLQELRDVTAEGLHFTLILESVPVESSQILGRFLRTFSGGSSFLCSSQNFYADTQSDENVFSTLLGKADTVIVLRHSAAQAAAKFSEYFGNYTKSEVSHTIVQGNTHNNFTQILPGDSYSNVYGVQQVDRPRVESNEIAQQPADHAFIRKNGITYSARLGFGGAQANADLPRGGTLRSGNAHESRTRRHRFNVLIFILLLFLPPFAFVYSLVVCGRRGKIISAVFLVLTIVFMIVAPLLTEFLYASTQQAEQISVLLTHELPLR